MVGFLSLYYYLNSFSPLLLFISAHSKLNMLLYAYYRLLFKPFLLLLPSSKRKNKHKFIIFRIRTRHEHAHQNDNNRTMCTVHI